MTIGVDEKDYSPVPIAYLDANGEMIMTPELEAELALTEAASPAWAAEILGRQIEELEHGPTHEIDPMALYRSYQRRQLAADFRLMAGAPELDRWSRHLVGGRA